MSSRDYWSVFIQISQFESNLCVRKLYFSNSWCTYSPASITKNVRRDRFLKCLGSTLPACCYGEIFDNLNITITNHGGFFYPRVVREDNPNLRADESISREDGTREKRKATPYFMRTQCNDDQVFYCLIAKRDSCTVVCDRNNIENFYLAELGNKTLKFINIHARIEQDEFHVMIHDREQGEVSLTDWLKGQNSKYIQKPPKLFQQVSPPRQGPILKKVINCIQVEEMMKQTIQSGRPPFFFAEIESPQDATSPPCFLPSFPSTPASPSSKSSSSSTCMNEDNQSSSFSHFALPASFMDSIEDNQSSDQEIQTEIWRHPKLFIQINDYIACIHLMRRQSDSPYDGIDEFCITSNQEPIFGIPVFTPPDQMHQNLYKYASFTEVVTKVKTLLQWNPTFKPQSFFNFEWMFSGFRIKNIRNFTSLMRLGSNADYIFALFSTGADGKLRSIYITSDLVLQHLQLDQRKICIQIEESEESEESRGDDEPPRQQAKRGTDLNYV